LVGVGEEPHAEDHIIINTQVKQASTHQIPVYNDSGAPITFKVESDILGASGDPTIMVPAKQKRDY